MNPPKAESLTPFASSGGEGVEERKPSLGGFIAKGAESFAFLVFHAADCSPFSPR
jgi:hypothetical protein